MRKEAKRMNGRMKMKTNEVFCAFAKSADACATAAHLCIARVAHQRSLSELECSLQIGVIRNNFHDG